MGRADHDFQQLLWQIQNEYKLHTLDFPRGWFVVSLDNPDKNATVSSMYWDQASRIAYMILIGSDKMDSERVNDFDNNKVTNPAVNKYLKENLQTLIENGTIDPNNPFVTAANLNSMIFPRFYVWKESTIKNWTTEFGTSMEWIRWQLLHNDTLGISQAAKDIWGRTYPMPINNHNDPYDITLVNWDINNDSILAPEEKMVYSNAGVQQNAAIDLITNYDYFVSRFLDSNAQNHTYRAILCLKDMEWSHAGCNWNGIDGIAKFKNSEAAKRAIGLIDGYGGNPACKVTADSLSTSIFSLYDLKDMPAFKDRNVVIGMPSDFSYTLTVSDE
jgi:hypothetical protein